MEGHTITLTVPDAIYRRAQETANASSLSVEDIFAQSVSRLLPPLKDDLPPSLRADLAVLSLKSDEQLQRIVADEVAQQAQQRLGTLASEQKVRALTEDEQTELEQLLATSYRFMLVKAEAIRLLGLRGYELFPFVAQARRRWVSGGWHPPTD